MKSEPDSAVPPLAGLCTHAEAARTGLAVEPTVSRLRRYAYIEAQCLFLACARFNALPEWEVKSALSLHLWQDAEHSGWFRTRVTEMRTPPYHLDRVPDPALAAFFAQLGKASDTGEYLAGVYDVLKPALAAAYREHLAQAHPIADHPTRRLLQFALTEIESQIAWGRAALAALAAEGTTEAWAAKVRTALDAAGGIHGDGPGRIGKKPSEAGEPAEAASSPASTALIPRRDGRFPHVWRSRGVVVDPDRPVHERLWWMMNVRLNEMHVAELIATVIADWKGQPWAFYHDLARHLWDETRHCLLGEAAFVSQGVDFTKIPSHVGFAEYPNVELPPAERYAFLWGIEQGLMAKTGKQAEVALAKAGGDERAAVFQDFDWADEVLHASIGRRWLEPHFSGRQALMEAYDRIRPAYDRMKEEDLKRPGRDWWPEFYARHLKDRDPQPGGSAVGEQGGHGGAAGYG